jgi:glycine/D-amino acid oxidase-like deaminating enzyme
MNSKPTRQPGITRRRVLEAGLGLATLGAAGTAYWINQTPVGLVPGRSRARAISSDASLPAAVDVVVIGGGFVGTSTALVLAERGVRVALCEKGVIAGEASGRSMGWVYSPLAGPNEWDLLARSKALWSALNSRTQVDTGFRATGVLVPLNTDEARAGAEMWLASIRDRPYADGRIVSGTELSALTRAMSAPPAGALYVPSDASVEPQLAAPAIAEGARRHGAIILQGCAVRGLDLKAGRIAGVVTEKGPIACQGVVLAGGAWSPLFLKSLGLSLTQFDAYLSMLSLAAPESGPAISFGGSKTGVRRQIDGGYAVGSSQFVVPIDAAKIRAGMRALPQLKAFWSVAHVGVSPSQLWHELLAPSTWPLDQPSPFEERRILMPPFSNSALENSLAEARALFPALRSATVRERWAGVISFADGGPVISAIDSIPGLHVGSGFSEGLTMGPATGEALADLVMGRKPVVDLRSYRFARSV